MQTILVTGSTGYVGGRLVPRLLQQGYHVKAISRNLSKVQGRPWAKHPQVELMEVDVLDFEALSRACQNVEAVFYLVHSMMSDQNDYQESDRKAAMNMAKASAASSVKRIIYLGGLGDDSPDLSLHLKSRAEVAHILSSGRVPVTVFRAAMIIGSGSASFELVRYLVDRFPIIIASKWLKTPNQPIAIRNAIHYLEACLKSPETIGRSFDIGGTDVLSYQQLMQIYAEEAGLSKRFIFAVPFFTALFNAYWVHLLTPVPASIVKPLIQGIRNPVVCRENTIQKLIPQRLLSCREAITLALERVVQDHVPSHWSDAGPIPPFEWAYKGDPDWSGGTLFKDKRRITIYASKENIWEIISQIGGTTGWYHADWLWRLRGWMDRLVGGVGLRRGRRSPTEIMSGDALDFWRVVDVQENRRLLLVAEMKLPGKALLEFKIIPLREGKCRLKQTAFFQPRGLMGIVYWYAVFLLHDYVFGGMQKKIAAKVKRK